MVDLSGTWRAAVAGESPRDEHHSPDFDDGSWAVATVPGHWRSDPAFAHTDGPVVYRTTFDDPGRFGPGTGAADADGPARRRRTWLVLDGVFYTSDVWLDGAYLGDTEGYFFPHQFEISDTLARPIRPHPGRGGGLPPPDGPARQAATSPGCSSTGTCSTRTGPRAGSGGRSTSSSPDRSGSATPGPAAST